MSITDLLDLHGHRALVTGASSNIGAAIARRLAQAGADVVIHYCNNQDTAKALAAELSAIGARAQCLQADLSVPDQAGHLFEAIRASGEEVDLVVNNAALQTVRPLADMGAQQWRQVMSANLDSAFLVTQLAAERLRASGRAGAIVNIASIEGLDPADGHAHYATSKAGMLMFTRTCALEYGKFNIRVNAISPGLIDRDGLETEWPDGVARWRSKAPLGRIGTGADIADAVLFLLSPAARWISGANLLVDGGMSAVSRW